VFLLTLDFISVLIFRIFSAVLLLKNRDTTVRSSTRSRQSKELGIGRRRDDNPDMTYTLTRMELTSGGSYQPPSTPLFLPQRRVLHTELLAILRQRGLRGVFLVQIPLVPACISPSVLPLHLSSHTKAIKFPSMAFIFAPRPPHLFSAYPTSLTFCLLVILPARLSASLSVPLCLCLSFSLPPSFTPRQFVHIS